MSELQFDIEVSWAGSGREGAGRIRTDDLEIEYSVPGSMGGRDTGTNPEELLVCAVATCYSATLFGVLRHERLPVIEVRVGAGGRVTGYPVEGRFERLTVSPTIVGGDPARSDEYQRAAEKAHARCFIGRTISGHVDYRVGHVQIMPVAEAAA